MRPCTRLGFSQQQRIVELVAQPTGKASTGRAGLGRRLFLSHTHPRRRRHCCAAAVSSCSEHRCSSTSRHVDIYFTSEKPCISSYCKGPCSCASGWFRSAAAAARAQRNASAAPTLEQDRLHGGQEAMGIVLRVCDRHPLAAQKRRLPPALQVLAQAVVLQAREPSSGGGQRHFGSQRASKQTCSAHHATRRALAAR